MFCLRGNMYAKTGGMRWSWIEGGGSGNSRCKGYEVRKCWELRKVIMVGA